MRKSLFLVLGCGLVLTTSATVARAESYSLGSTDLQLGGGPEGCIATLLETSLSGVEQVKIGGLEMVVGDTDGHTDLYWYVLEWQTSDWDIIWDGCPSGCAAPVTPNSGGTVTSPPVGVTWGPSHYPPGDYAVVFCWANLTDVQVFAASPMFSGSAETLISGTIESQEDLWRASPTDSPPLFSPLTFQDSGWMDPPWTIILDEDLDGDFVTDLTGGDCDDSDSTVYPLAPELCDGIDNDCVGGVPGDEVDDDADGWVECATWIGADPSISGGGDCDDGEDTVHPFATENCDGMDNNCNGIADGATDADLDGWGAGGCPSSDCDDNDNSIYPWLDPSASDNYEHLINSASVWIDEDCDGLNCEADWDFDFTYGSWYFALCGPTALGGWKTWGTAQAACAVRYLGLAPIRSDAQNAHVDNLRGSLGFGAGEWWIGGTDVDSEGDWVWRDADPGTPDEAFDSDDEARWALSNPSSSFSSNCARGVYDATGSEWEDRDCSNTQYPFWLCGSPD